jgi:glycosyltransferase involved in cell wall biosynthesis
VPEARLVLVGDGPERARLDARWPTPARGGADHLPRRALSRDDALRTVAGADAALLSSDWENLPHSAVEALSVGVPVVSTAVGGVPEVVRDGENGLLVPPGARERARGRDPNGSSRSPGCARRLAAAAKPSVAAIFERGDLRPARGAAGGGARDDTKPRVLFVGRMRYHLPLPAWLAKKWDAVERELDYRVVGAASADSAPSGCRFPPDAAVRAAPARRLPLLRAAPLRRAQAHPRLPPGRDLRLRSRARRGRALADAPWPAGGHV